LCNLIQHFIKPSLKSSCAVLEQQFSSTQEISEVSPPPPGGNVRCMVTEPLIDRLHRNVALTLEQNACWPCNLVDVLLSIRSFMPYTQYRKCLSSYLTILCRLQIIGMFCAWVRW